MTPRWTVALIAIGLGLLSGCTILQSNSQPEQPVAKTPTGESPISESPISESPTINPSPSPSVASPLASPAPTDRPNTRVMPMTIEGSVVEMELRLFDKQPLPFTTYVPTKDFQSEVNQSDQGIVAQFFFSPKGKKDASAYVQIFSPFRETSVEEMRQLLLGEQGLLSANHWSLVDRTDIVSYSWAREKLIYQQQQDKQTFVGSIYIGDHKGQAFYALTHYPAEYMDGFEPRSTVMLENLQFRDEKL